MLQGSEEHNEEISRIPLEIMMNYEQPGTETEEPDPFRHLTRQAYAWMRAKMGGWVLLPRARY